MDSPMPFWAIAPYKIVLFYRYVKVDIPEELKLAIEKKCSALCMVGRVLVAEEGINGTLAAPATAMQEFIAFMESDKRFECGKVDWKYSNFSSWSPA